MSELIQRIIGISGQRTAIFLNRKNREKINQLEKFAQIGKISSGIIHDLISPITSLKLQISLLKERDLRNDGFLKSIKESLEDIEKYSSLVKYYISNNDQREVVNLSETIENSLKLISYNAIKKSVQLQFIRDPSLKLFTKPIFIYQIIISLVSNSIESFRDSDNIRKIVVKIQEVNNNIVISVKDYGRGIKNTKIIFNQFYTTKGNIGGTGIGLSNVKHIVESEMKGKLSVNSKPEKGSTFFIYLPILENQ